MLVTNSKICYKTIDIFLTLTSVRVYIKKKKEIYVDD